MSEQHRRHPSAAMIVAVIALVVATTETAFAGGPIERFATHLINGSSIKPHSVHGRQLAKHTLTGKQINLSKLGTVPHARNADSLGGAPASSYFLNSKLLRWSTTMNKGDAPRTVGRVGPLTLTASCTADGAKTDAVLSASTSEPNTFVSNSPSSLPGGTTINPGTNYKIVEQDTSVANDGNSNAFASFDAQGKLAVFSTAQTVGLAINTGGADCRFFGNLLNDA